jgi:hypothetical protein
MPMQEGKGLQELLTGVRVRHQALELGLRRTKAQVQLNVRFADDCTRCFWL